MNKYEKHLLYTNDDTIDKYSLIGNGIFNLTMSDKYILDICMIENDLSVLYLENENSNKVKQIFFETDKY